MSIAALHTRRCGWLSGQQLGMEMLERARAAGVELIEGRLAAVETTGGRVTGVKITGRSGNRTIANRALRQRRRAHARGGGSRLLDLDLPVVSELHLKTSFEDHLGVVPRDLPFLIWDDPQRLAWSPEEREALAENEGTRRLTETLARGGAHAARRKTPRARAVALPRRRGGRRRFPWRSPTEYTEVCLRGLTRVLPGLSAYVDRLAEALCRRRLLHQDP